MKPRNVVIGLALIGVVFLASCDTEDETSALPTEPKIELYGKGGNPGKVMTVDSILIVPEFVELEPGETFQFGIVVWLSGKPYARAADGLAYNVDMEFRCLKDRPKPIGIAPPSWGIVDWPICQRA